MPLFPTTGSHPLTGVANLPNATVAFPGEHWSNRIAKGTVTPGTAVLTVNYGGKLAVQTAAAGDPIDQIGLALRTIDVPDVANDSVYTTSLGPNQIKNLPIADGSYVHQYMSGAFHLTLVKPRAWAPAELVSWNPTGTRPTGKTGTGSWDLAGTSGTTDPFFEVMEFRPFSSDGHEGLLTVRSLRGQF